jgi:hypothetical protein
VLERLGVRHHIGGSLASGVHGVPRSTVDVDLVADLHAGQIASFVQQLAENYYLDEETAREAVRSRRSFNLLHLDTMTKVDIFIPEGRPFDEQEMSRSRPQTLDTGMQARSFFLKSPEDVVLRKLDWYRLGGGVSERQWSDVLGVIKMQADQLDRAYLNRWAAELGLNELLERALAAAEE